MFCINHPPTHPPTHLFIHLSTHPPTYSSIHTHTRTYLARRAGARRDAAAPLSFFVVVVAWLLSLRGVGGWVGGWMGGMGWMVDQTPPPRFRVSVVSAQSPSLGEGVTSVGSSACVLGIVEFAFSTSTRAVCGWVGGCGWMGYQTGCRRLTRDGVHAPPPTPSHPGK